MHRQKSNKKMGGRTASEVLVRSSSEAKKRRPEDPSLRIALDHRGSASKIKRLQGS